MCSAPERRGYAARQSCGALCSDILRGYCHLDFRGRRSPTTAHVDRSKSFTLTKSRLNEDPETTASGSEVADELIAQARVGYAANPPVPAPAFSSLVTGVWV